MLSPATTARLVRLARDGDERALAALIGSHLRPAYAVALAIVRRPTDAEDVAQDALLTAVRRLTACREPERFSAWLFTIVRNRALTIVAGRRLRDVQAEHDPYHPGRGDEPAGRSELRAGLAAALGTLSHEQREVVLLHDLEGCTHEEIGAVQGCSELVSRQRLFKARKRLRVALDEWREPRPALAQDDTDPSPDPSPGAAPEAVLASGP